MSKYQPYPVYKNSEVEWLGEVPEHWYVLPVKYLLQSKKGSIKTGPFGSHLKNSDMKEAGEAKVVNQRNVITHDLYSFDYYVDLNKSKELKSFQIYKDDILITTRGTIGKAVIVKEDIGKAILHPCLIRIQPQKTKVLNEFLSLLIQDSGYVLEQILIKSNSTTIEVIYSDNLINIDISIPNTLEEQASILNFLAHETAKIDTLIEKQKKLTTLLKEKRQAVISHAVTKGLDPNVKMKDSGVEWLGEVPEGWIVTKIKNMLSTPVTDGPHETPEFLDEGVPFVSAEAISKGYINFNKIRGHISQEDNKKYSRKYSPKLHDVYMIKSGATTGITAIVDDRVDFNIWSPLAVFRSNVNLEPYYLLNYLRSANLQKAVELFWSFGTQQNIGMNVLENLYISIPPIKEQQAIASYLNEKSSKIDTLIEKANQAITLFKERRTALISAAVTGKIDVRGEVV